MTEPKKKTNMLFSCKPIAIEDNDILVRFIQAGNRRLSLILCNQKGNPIGAGNLLSIVFNRDGKMGQLGIHSSVNQKQDVIMLDEGHHIYCEKYSRKPSRYQEDYVALNPRPQRLRGPFEDMPPIGHPYDDEDEEEFFDDLDMDEEDR